MKQKIRVKDKQTGKIIEGELTLRDLTHFEIQKRNRAQVFKNKKAYTRKRKHKKEDF